MYKYLGEIRLFAGNFPPRGWVYCDGETLSISQNQELFSLLGTTYGGDGRSTFELPDMRGRVPIGAGQGAGLSNRVLGTQLGQEEVELQESEIPAHTHEISANGSAGSGTSNSPTNMFPGVGQLNNNNPVNTIWTGSSNATMNSGMLEEAGASAGHENSQPYNTLNYIICVEGEFPTRT